MIKSGTKPETYHLGLTRVPWLISVIIMADDAFNKSKDWKSFKRQAFKILTPKILKPRSEGQKQLISISGFIRERIIMRAARESSKRAQKARKLDIPLEEMPLPDPVWRKYQNQTLKLEDFDISGCDKDDNLFEFGQEFVELVSAAEIGPDDGIPINEKVTLPRSFLLDSIHFAASQHCLYMQKKLGKPWERSECPSPAERAKPFEGINDYYRTTVKIITGKMKRNWIKFGEGKSSNNSLSGDESSDDNEEILVEDISDGNSVIVRSPTDPDFDSILNHLLDLPFALDPVPSAYEYPDDNDFGADVLWSFDTSSLLAFGMLAEEFISRMIDIHLTDGSNDFAENVENDEESDSFLLE